MHFLRERGHFLFASTKGLILLAMAMISIVTALFGMLSGPMEELGARDVVVHLLRINLVQAEREGRIIILYHSIAIAVVAIEVYLINSLLPMKESLKTWINRTITVGYLCTMIFGLLFAYWGHNWAFHGLYLFGLALTFFAGCVLAIGLWPWNRAYFIQDPAYAHTRSGLDLERTAFFTMAVVTLASSLFGAVPGSYFGNGFQVFLAEDIIRTPEKSALQLSVIGHLHIMLALIAVAITLIVGRWLDFKGLLHKIAMPLMIVGSIILSMGTWFVVPFETYAHIIIYVGSVFAMLAALMLVIFGWDKLIRQGLAGQKGRRTSFFQKVAALVHDPLRFGPLWQMVFMNFTVSGVGIFMAVRLDEIFRVWPWREERIPLTGHWHILSAIIATIILMIYGDLAGLKGKIRQWYGWLIIVLSDVAFASATVFEMKRLFVSEAEQQPLVNTVMLLIDLSLGAILVVLAMLMIWRLSDLFKRKGRWSAEIAEEGVK